MSVNFDFLICIAAGTALGLGFGLMKNRKRRNLVSHSNWQRTAVAGAMIGLIYYAAFGSSMFFQEPKNLKPVSEKNFASELASADKPVVVDFFATWCGPCKMLSPRLDELAGEFSNRVEFLSVDVDQAPNLSAKYGVRVIPTVLFFNQEGQLADTSVGLVSESALRSQLTAVMATSALKANNAGAD